MAEGGPVGIGEGGKGGVEKGLDLGWVGMMRQRCYFSVLPVLGSAGVWARNVGQDTSIGLGGLLWERCCLATLYVLCLAASVVAVVDESHVSWDEIVGAARALLSRQRRPEN